jgi:hypothetical protein
VTLQTRKPTKRGTALRRVTPLASITPLVRYTRIRPVSKKRAREIVQRRAMLRRMFPEQPLCSVPWCARLADDAHEPLTRGRGGSITDPENVQPVCRPHHDAITFEEPEWAYELGLLVHSWDGRAA